MKNKEVFVVKSFHSEDGALDKRLGQKFLSVLKTTDNVIFRSRAWGVSERKITYFKDSQVEHASGLRFNDSKRLWDDWNLAFIPLIRAYSDLLGSEKLPLSGLSQVLNDIPCTYAMRTRFQNMWYELGDEEGQTVNPKSLFCMLRFLPALELKQSELGFFLDEDTGRLGVNISQDVANEHRKTLDLVFNENGEVHFTFIEGGEGYSRISGSSYLTDYLVNSSKFRKLINIFDY